MNNKTQGKIYFSLSIVFFFSIIMWNACSNHKKIPPAEKRKRVAAIVLRPDSTFNIDVVLMQSYVSTKYDSVKGQYIVIKDTLWGIPIATPIMDTATKKPKLGADGLPMYNVKYNYYPKDSIIYNFELIDYDSLLKKYWRKPFK